MGLLDLHKYAQLTFGKSAKAVPWGRVGLLSGPGAAKHPQALSLTPSAEMNSKWVMDLHVKGKTIKFLGK